MPLTLIKYGGQICNQGCGSVITISRKVIKCAGRNYPQSTRFVHNRKVEENQLSVPFAKIWDSNNKAINSDHNFLPVMSIGMTKRQTIELCQNKKVIVPRTAEGLLICWQLCVDGRISLLFTFVIFEVATES